MEIPENSRATVCLNNLLSLRPFYETFILSKERVKARRERDPVAVTRTDKLFTCSYNSHSVSTGFFTLAFMPPLRSE